MRSRAWISRAVSRVLDGAEDVGIEYSVALGFFNSVDWELIGTGVYGEKQIRHALETYQADSELLPRQSSREL